MSSSFNGGGTQRFNLYLNLGFFLYMDLRANGLSRFFQAGTKGRGWWWNHNGVVTHGQRWVGHFGAHDSCSLAANKLGSRGGRTLGEWDQAYKGVWGL